LINNKIVNKKWLYIIGESGGIVILGFLCKLSLPINFRQYQEYQNTIQEQKDYIVEFNQEIIKAKYQLFAQDFFLSKNANTVDIWAEKLATIPDFIKDKKTIERKIKLQLESFKNQKEALKQFQEKNKILNNSWQYLIEVRKEVIQGQNESYSQNILVSNLDELIQDLILYKLADDNYLGSQVQAKLDKIKQLPLETINDKNNFLLEQTVKHGEIILHNKPEVENLFKQLRELTTLEQIKDIEVIYNSEYQQAIQTMSFYRLATYGWSLLLLSWIAFLVISNLSRTNRSIIKILENFTEELETKVEERTSQLEESIEEAERALAKAKEANQAKSRFLANMSHELRTPLNAILGFTQLMCRDRSLNRENRENLSIISRSGEHLLKLINDILEMSKIEAGQIALHESNFDLYSLLSSLEEMFRLKAQSKNLKLLFIKDEQVPQFIKTDESKLRQVLINLLGNALKFTEEGSITLKLQWGRQLKREGKKQWENTFELFVADESFLHFQVEDTGAGIDSQELDKLFTPFEQTELGRKSQEGTGLGLSICQKYVQLMGGELAVDSTVGEGTIFSFDIIFQPVAPIQTESSSYKKVMGLAPNQPSYRILAVDDRRESRLLLVKLLSSLGFEVKEASNGQEAVQVWQTWEPHLILMDMRMPVMDGYEATKQIKADLKGQQTVVIALTASAFEEERIVVLAAGCDDFMRKPFQEEKLLEKIAEHLGVNYLYEEPESTLEVNPEQKSQKTISDQLTRKDLEAMSIDWRWQLYEAANQVDNQAIFALIEQIPGEYAALAESLKTLVYNFRCDKIIDLTESGKE
jgi:signal transduction histidine kinase/CheY-like chemotaxis protein